MVAPNQPEKLWSVKCDCNRPAYRNISGRKSICLLCDSIPPPKDLLRVAPPKIRYITYAEALEIGLACDRFFEARGMKCTVTNKFIFSSEQHEN